MSNFETTSSLSHLESKSDPDSDGYRGGVPGDPADISALCARMSAPPGHRTIRHDEPTPPDNRVTRTLTFEEAEMDPAEISRLMEGLEAGTLQLAEMKRIAEYLRQQKSIMSDIGHSLANGLRQIMVDTGGSSTPNAAVLRQIVDQSVAPHTPYNVPGKIVVEVTEPAGRMKIDPLSGVPDFILRDWEQRVSLEGLDKGILKIKREQKLPKLSSKPDNMQVAQWLRGVDQLAYYTYGYDKPYDNISMVAGSVEEPYRSYVESVLAQNPLPTWAQFLTNFGRNYYDIFDAGDSVAQLMALRQREKQLVLEYALYFQRVLGKAKSIDPLAGFLGNIFYRGLLPHVIQYHPTLPPDTFLFYFCCKQALDSNVRNYATRA